MNTDSEFTPQDLKNIARLYSTGFSVTLAFLDVRQRQGRDDAQARTDFLAVCHATAADDTATSDECFLAACAMAGIDADQARKLNTAVQEALQHPKQINRTDVRRLYPEMKWPERMAMVKIANATFDPSARPARLSSTATV